MHIRSSIALIAVACGSLAVAAPGASAESKPEPQQMGVAAAGRAPLKGAAAIERLGDRLDDVAARHRWTEDELEHMFRTDKTLGIDANEQLFYTEPPIVTVLPEPEPEPPVAESEDDDTFELHSRPEAPLTIYLDFDGHMVTGSAWTGAYTGGASCYGDPFTTDGDANTFSAGERTIIRSVWERVAEDFAPFDVDVTTEEPDPARLYRTNSSDEEFGTRALITSATTVCSNSKTLYQSICPGGCGGVAYVGVFNFPGSWHSAYQPAFVFNNALSNSAKSIAEATSHEVGHNLGLHHDGATIGCGSGGLSACSYYYGQNMWAPIMGVGYSKPVVQWSNGDYSVANNFQDDFAVMQSYELELRDDDHGDNREGATEVDPAGFEEAGVIESEDDIDVFGLNVGAGSATFSVSPAANSPNLDAKLELRDDSFDLVAVNDPAAAFSTTNVATGLGATVSATLDEGRYYLVIDGVGVGTSATGYSDYASVGQYELTGSAVAADPESFSAPGTPTDVMAFARNSSIELEWTTPDDEGNAPVNDYTVSVYAEDGGAATGVTGATSRTVGSADTSYTFTGLTNDTTYQVKIAATSAIGTSDETDGDLVTPDGTAPETTLTKPTGTWTLGTSVPVAWTADENENGSGLASTQVVRRTGTYSGTLGSASTWKAAATVTPTTYAGGYGATYCFKARARDHAGNVDDYTAERCTAVPLKAANLSYSSGWTSRVASDAYGGGLRTVTKKNAHMARSGIKAKKVALIATKCPTCGTVKIYWNGVYKKTIKLTASAKKRKQIVSLFSFGSVTSGTLKVVVSSSGKTVTIEGLGVSKV